MTGLRTVTRAALAVRRKAPGSATSPTPAPT